MREVCAVTSFAPASGAAIAERKIRLPAVTAGLDSVSGTRAIVPATFRRPSPLLLEEPPPGGHVDAEPVPPAVQRLAVAGEDPVAGHTVRRRNQLRQPIVRPAPLFETAAGE